MREQFTDEADEESLRNQLFAAAIRTLQRLGWTVERIPGFGKASVRRITKGGQRRKVSIRTSQDRYIAFPRNHQDNGWVTLDDVDVVVPVSVDDSENPQYALVHMIEASEVRDRFNRAYAARRAAGHTIQLGRGLWLSLYDEEADEPVKYVGAGVGLAHPPIAHVPLGSAGQGSNRDVEPGAIEPGGDDAVDEGHDDDDKPLTIPEAKRRLARTLGVHPSNIKISVEA